MMVWLLTGSRHMYSMVLQLQAVLHFSSHDSVGDPSRNLICPEHMGCQHMQRMSRRWRSALTNPCHALGGCALTAVPSWFSRNTIHEPTSATGYAQLQKFAESCQPPSHAVQ
jgi:hypothetical protein